MFGFVTANWKELTADQQTRYTAVYCGICRQIRERSGQIARLGLSYDMAFLALLLMSLYEPQEQSGVHRCPAHPLQRRTWADSECIGYAADMNVLLAYYKALDDWQDDGSAAARLLAKQLEPAAARIRQQWPRQCGAVETQLRALSSLESAGEENPDLPAGAFGRLLAELLVYREDLWAGDLRELGFHLGRFIYLADAMLDYEKDVRKHSYNPFRTSGRDPEQWEQYLLLAMGRCSQAFERLPLVQDKQLLDNILYSGVWVSYRSRIRKEEQHG